MPDFKNRSPLLELLDAPGIPFADIRQNMKELNRVNSLLGGHAITIAGVKKLLEGYQSKEPVVVCEIGCGGGDNMLAIAGWCRRNNISVKFIGIDMKQECITFAMEQCKSLDAVWITSDYRKADLSKTKPSIIFSSLFCHHFSNQSLPPMLQWMQEQSTVGFFINDLHRHFLAYYSIKYLTAIFSKSYLVKHDAPLSVARGFTTPEWKQIASSAGITRCSIQWRWAFRHLIVYRHDR